MRKSILSTKIVIRIDFDKHHYIGHGRIRLLELISEHQSISGAAKAMGMSYKRAWYLLEAFGACFSEPLIERQQGGRGGGHARLTRFGEEVVRRYRKMEIKAFSACRSELKALKPRLAKAKRKTARSG